MTGLAPPRRSLLTLNPLGGRVPKEKKKEHYTVFPVSDKNTKEKRIVVRIMAKNIRHERVSAVAVAMMGRGKWSTKDYEILARWFKLRREREEGCVHCWSKGSVDERKSTKDASVKNTFSKLKVL
ncbi:hypothetical protein AVEN_262630-1 [Araneus ventricosus]|uniref:Uncharacterized protein n=1 Tax=Araneus ventricosus TaxID=182803 RepID=A0A4Y2NWE0_ARAVE|nr:hypothetical protein AVEN_262630-1 [Araneus ventricosus]